VVVFLRGDRMNQPRPSSVVAWMAEAIVSSLCLSGGPDPIPLAMGSGAP
jgi:hypothetical protein